MGGIDITASSVELAFSNVLQNFGYSCINWFPILYNVDNTYRHDVIAQIHHAERLAAKLNPVARMVDLHGGHLVSHERTEEVPTISNTTFSSKNKQTLKHVP